MLLAHTVEEDMISSVLFICSEILYVQLFLLFWLCISVACLWCPGTGSNFWIYTLPLGEENRAWRNCTSLGMSPGPFSASEYITVTVRKLHPNSLQRHVIPTKTQQQCFWTDSSKSSRITPYKQTEHSHLKPLACPQLQKEQRPLGAWRC